MALLIPLTAAVIALALLVRWLEPRMAFFPFPGEAETPRDFGVPFEAMTLDTKDGERLRAWLMTPPPPQAARARILYFHGNGGNLSNWSPILAGIARRGYSVLAVDYRGYGLSTGRPTERGLYRDVDAVVARPWTEADSRLPLIYWGRSLGGAMAGYAATVRKPDGVIVEAGFAFIGLGAQPPTPSLGQMIADGRIRLTISIYPAIVPGVAIAIIVLALNSFGDGLRDIFDPRTRRY
jgi:hypothetical protein